VNKDMLAENSKLPPVGDSHPAGDSHLAHAHKGVTFICANEECGSERYWEAPESPGEDPRRVCAYCSCEYYVDLKPSSRVSGNCLPDVTES